MQFLQYMWQDFFRLITSTMCVVDHTWQWCPTWRSCSSSSLSLNSSSAPNLRISFSSCLLNGLPPLQQHIHLYLAMATCCFLHFKHEQVVDKRKWNENRCLPWLWANGAAVEDRSSSGIHALDDQVVKHHLLLGPLHNVLLHRALGHQPVHADLQSNIAPFMAGSSIGNIKICHTRVHFFNCDKL